MPPTDQNTEIENLKHLVLTAQIPPELKDKALAQIERILMALKYGGNVGQLDIVTKYVDYITHLPWFTLTEDNIDMQAARQILDAHHYGLEKIKERIMEYIAVIKLHKERGDEENFRSPVLFFVGLAGTGKSTIAPSIAQALGRAFYRIPFGGLSSPLDLRGQSKTSPEAEPGAIIKALRAVGSRNPVILLDELDRVEPEARSAIMGVLLELLDPGQNSHFTDYFIDYPIDLSRVLFIATANNTTDVSTAVLDRMETIRMPSYTDEEKIHIAKNYVLPKILTQVGLPEHAVQIDEALWPKLIRPLGFESGIRGVEKLIDGMVRKAALMSVQQNLSHFIITEQNVNDFVQPSTI